MLGLLLIAASLLVHPRRQRGPLAALINPKDVPRVIAMRDNDGVPMIDHHVADAKRAGASDNLEFIGAGMTSVVFRDLDSGLCYKVSRQGSHALEWKRDAMEDEFLWLQAAQKVSGVRELVVKPVRFHRPTATIVRQCVDGKPGGWSDEGRLFTLHKQIEARMIPHGWNAPEFKGDSWICQGAPEREPDNKFRTHGRSLRCRRPILVDAGMVQRVGPELIEYVRDVIAGGRLRSDDTRQDLKFYVRRERGQTIDDETANDLLEKLG